MKINDGEPSSQPATPCKSPRKDEGLQTPRRSPRKHTGSISLFAGKVISPTKKNIPGKDRLQSPSSQSTTPCKSPRKDEGLQTPRRSPRKHTGSISLFSGKIISPTKKTIPVTDALQSPRRSPRKKYPSSPGTSHALPLTIKSPSQKCPTESTSLQVTPQSGRKRKVTTDFARLLSTKRRKKVQPCNKEECGPCIFCNSNSNRSWCHLQTIKRTDLVLFIKSNHDVSDTDCFCLKCKNKFEDKLYNPNKQRASSRVKKRPDCFLKLLDACSKVSEKEKQSETSAGDFMECFDVNLGDIPLPSNLSLCQPHYSKLLRFEESTSCSVCTEVISGKKYFSNKDQRKMQHFFVKFIQI